MCVLIWTQSKVTNPQSAAASCKLRPRFGVNLASMLGPLAVGVTALLTASEQLVAVRFVTYALAVEMSKKPGKTNGPLENATRPGS